MTEEFIHVGYREQQQPETEFMRAIWNYYGLDFNVTDAKRRGFRVEKVFANTSDQARQDYRKERRMAVVAKARARIAWKASAGGGK